MTPLEEFLAAFDEHHEHWAATLHETPEGWTEATCTAYRMAMDYVAMMLEPVRRG